jgi:hypothetical protein
VAPISRIPKAAPAGGVPGSSASFVEAELAPLDPITPLGPPGALPQGAPAQAVQPVLEAPDNPGRRAWIAALRAHLAKARADLASNPRFSFSSAVDQLLAEVDAKVRAEIGEPPSGYQLLALGSYGRNELAPFSDLDYAILIERDDRAVRAYFERYADRVETLVAEIDGDDRIHACDLISPSGDLGSALVDTPEGLARRVAGLDPELAKRSLRDQDYLRTSLSQVRPIFGNAPLAERFAQLLEAQLGPPWPRVDPKSPRAELLSRVLRSLRDPFGLPADVPGWLGPRARSRTRSSRSRPRRRSPPARSTSNTTS